MSFSSLSVLDLVVIFSSDRLSRAATAGRQIKTKNGGIASAPTAGREHSRIALSYFKSNLARDALPVKFGDGLEFEDLSKCVAEAREKRFVSKSEATDLLDLGSRAENNGVVPLVKLGNWGYAVREDRTRTFELDWAHVKYDNPAENRTAGWPSRRIAVERRLMCKVSQR